MRTRTKTAAVLLLLAAPTLAGCFAKSAFVDKLAKTVSALADEIVEQHPESRNAPVIASYAKMLADEGSAIVDGNTVVGAAMRLASGDWVGAAGTLVAAAAAAYGVKMRGNARREHDTAEAVARLSPGEAAEELKRRGHKA